MPRLCHCLVLVAFQGLLLGAAQGSEYDVRSSYAYAFDPHQVRFAEVEVRVEGFAWPPVAPAADTVFLELSVEARKGSRRREPWIEARAAGAGLRQYLEPRARGRRYLNLSSFASAGLAEGQEVVLTGHGVAWEAQAARLLLFDNPPLESRRVLVLAPHPDDAEIAAFGVYSSTAADVVTVTAGDAGGFNFHSLYREPGTHYRIKGLVRTWDSVTVPLLGGVPAGRARNLGYYDATLRKLYEVRPEPLPPPLAELDRPDQYRKVNLQAALRDRPFEPTWEGLVGDLLEELEAVEPHVVVAPHPTLDRHWDHQFTTVALLEALERWAETEWELYLYTNHFVLAEAHPFGPSSGVASLPPWFGRELVFSRLYSHPLTPDQVRLKILALESMHDLRPFDVARHTGDPALADPRPPRQARRERRRERRAGLTLSYFRRAPRPNELFFVLTPDDARRLYRSFVTSLDG